MKKTLIALAALASTAAFAQSNVTIFGHIDPSFVIQSNTYGNGNKVTQSGLQNNRQGTSQISFKGTEDLGGGLKAEFLFEGDFNSTNAVASGNTLGDGGGELFVGVSGGFGRLRLGAPNTPTLYAELMANPFGTKIGSGFGAMSTARVRSNNSIGYNSPSFGGFSVAVFYANKTKADANPATPVAEVASATDVGLTYANGPIAAGVALWKTASTATTAAQNQTSAYVTYDLGMAKVGAGYYTDDNSGTIDTSAYNLSVSVPMGAVTLMANYGKKDDKVAANNDRKVMAVGAKYALSKRTSVYARYVSDETDNVGASAVGKSTYTLAGIQHSF